MTLLNHFQRRPDGRCEPSSCIDTESDPGSYAFLIAHGAHSMNVSEYGADETWLDKRLAARKAARLEPNPWARGWLTRAIDRAAR